MPNQVWNKETERITNENNLIELQKFFNELNNDDDWENPHEYIITENNYISEPNVYKLFNLKIACIEDGAVVFDDFEGIFEENMYNDTPLSLHHMLIDNISLMDDNGEEILISTSSTYIKIKY